MGYYMGDFYQGDFYSGDPGFFSFFGRAARAIGRVATGAAPRARMALPAATPSIVRASPAAAGIAHTGIQRIRTLGGHAIQRVTGQIMKHPVLSAAGAAAAAAAGGGALEARMHPAAAGLPSRGFHISKVSGGVVRNRRMRVTNVRALRRAIRRATGFARLARRVLHFTSPRPPRGRPYFRLKRKKRV